MGLLSRISGRSKHLETQADKHEYRIVADAYNGYEVQVRSSNPIGWNAWKQHRTNSHSTLDAARQYIDTVVAQKVYEQGTYPPRTPHFLLSQQDTRSTKAKKSVQKNATP